MGLGPYKKRRKRHRNRQGEGHVVMEAESGVMLLQAEEHQDRQRPLEDRREPWNRLPLRSLRRNPPSDILVSRFLVPRTVG